MDQYSLNLHLMNATYSNLSLPSSWVEIGQCLPEIVAVEVGVYFGGRDGFVTQHLLHGAKVGTPFDEVRGKRMPERVWADRFGNTRRGCQRFNGGEDSNAR